MTIDACTSPFTGEMRSRIQPRDTARVCRFEMRMVARASDEVLCIVRILRSAEAEKRTRTLITELRDALARVQPCTACYRSVRHARRFVTTQAIGIKSRNTSASTPMPSSPTASAPTACNDSTPNTPNASRAANNFVDRSYPTNSFHSSATTRSIRAISPSFSMTTGGV